MKPHPPALAILLILLALSAPAAPQLRARSESNSDFSQRTLSDLQKSWIGRAQRHEKHGWIYLHIEGAAPERGFQYGYTMAGEIAECLRVHRAYWEHSSGMPWTWYVDKAKTILEPGVDPENLAEIDGIVAGLEAAGHASSREEIIAFNADLEFADYWWPTEKKKLKSNAPDPPKQACSSFIATGRFTADHGVVLGHNTMFSYPEADGYLVLDILPEKGHRIIMQTTPGWIHSGTDFFVTDAGLVGSETTIGGFEGFDAKGIPEFVRMRRATQDASSLDQWCAIMKQGNNGGYANAWLLGDVHSQEIARLELGLKNIGYEKTRDGYFVGSNVAENLQILRFETDERETDIRESSVARRVRWKQLMSQYAGKIDLAIAKSFEADHYDAFLKKTRPGSRSLCAHGELDREVPGNRDPFRPGGTFDAKVVDSTLARNMSFDARWGSACGRAFDAAKFLAAHPQFEWMRDILKNRPAEPWTQFHAGETQ